MTFGRLLAFPLLAVATIALSSCERAGTIAGGGPGSDYSVARQALETGNYDLAIRHYQGLLNRVHPTSAARLQLEYAHGLLRGNRFSEAIQASDVLIDRPDDSIRGSALAVRGTARHELARQLIERGQRDAQVRQLLEGARDDLAHFLAQHADLDSGGSMRARSQLVISDLGLAG